MQMLSLLHSLKFFQSCFGTKSSLAGFTPITKVCTYIKVILSILCCLTYVCLMFLNKKCCTLQTTKRCISFNICSTLLRTVKSFSKEIFYALHMKVFRLSANKVQGSNIFISDLVLTYGVQKKSLLKKIRLYEVRYYSGGHLRINKVPFM